MRGNVFTVVSTGCCLCIHYVQTNVCKHISDSKHGHLFASAQCLGYSFEFGHITDELCSPPKTVILDQVKQAVKNLGAVAVFVAADRDHMISEFETTLNGKVRCSSSLLLLLVLILLFIMPKGSTCHTALEGHTVKCIPMNFCQFLLQYFSSN